MTTKQAPRHAEITPVLQASPATAASCITDPGTEHTALITRFPEAVTAATWTGCLRCQVNEDVIARNDGSSQARADELDHLAASLRTPDIEKKIMAVRGLVLTS